MLAQDEFPETRPSLLDSLRDTTGPTGWREFFRWYAPAVYGVARVRGLKHEDADDLVQQVMLEVSAHIGDFAYAPDRGRFRNWLRTIAERRIIDAFRRRRPEMSGQAGLEDCVDDRPTLAEAWEQEWRVMDLRFCLEQVAMDISPRRMRAFQMYSLQGCSADEVAAELSMTRGYVYATRCQVLSMIRERMRAMDNE